MNGVAKCGDCHTPVNQHGEPVPGQSMKGSVLGFKPLGPVPGWMAAAPDIAGLPGLSTEESIRLLMTGVGPDGQLTRPPMPQYRLNRADAEAITIYLKSLK